MSRYFSAPEVDAGLDYPRLIDALSEAVRRDGEAMPARQSYNVGTAASPGRLLTMPAWERGKALGVKLVTVFQNKDLKSNGSARIVPRFGRKFRMSFRISGEAL